jgi:gliding motility-associated-like protein
MVSNPSANFGWLFKLQTEALYRCMAFASSDNAVTSWRPKLTVIYCTVPDSAGTISGPDSVCQGDVGKVYTVPPITNSINYIWNLPSGASITGGSNTDSITVSYSMNAVSGNITVYGSDSCGTGIPSLPFPVTVNPAPVAYAGPNGTTCQDMPFTVTNAFADNYSGFFWSDNGSGTLTGDSTLSPTYIPAQNETGPVTLTLTVIGNFPCGDTTSHMILEINPMATAEAGPDSMICQGTFFKVTQATASNYSGILWTNNGSGILTGDTTLNPTYIPADNETGTITLVMTVFGIPPCGDTSDMMFLHITPKAMAKAGPDTTTCGRIPVLITGSSAANYSSLTWITSGSGTFDDPSILHPVYTPDANDSIQGHVILTLTAKALEPCPDVSCSMTLTISTSAIVNAGPDDSICQDKSYTVSGASAHLYNSLLWTQNGKGTLTGATTLTPTYTPGIGETGIVTLTIYAFTDPPCTNDSSRMHLNIKPPAYANAGEDESICKANAYILANASAKGYTSVTWTTSGNGSFNDIHDLHPVYFPGDNDILTGKVFLILTATGQSPCNSISDSMTLSIASMPVVYAGPDGSTCLDIPFQVIGANAQKVSRILWTDNGTGTLYGVNTLSPIYYPSPGDTDHVILTLTAYGNTACSDTFSTDQMVITVYHPPVVDAGPDQHIPFNSGTILSGTVSGGSGHYALNWEPASLLENNTVEKPETVYLTNDTVFWLNIRDSVSGCNSSDSMRVKVGPREYSEDCLIFHNVITPNGDGLNDTWIIDCIEEFPHNKADIFNRWGDKVNSFQNYNNTTIVWKGTNSEGEALPDGTYFYTLSIRNGGTHNGWVLIRSGSK